nr:MAG TPA: hypothetical protein [Caudoviricetes sp.]
MHGRYYGRYSRAVFSEEFELFKTLIFFCSFPFHSFFLLPDLFRLQCGVAKISHKIYSVKQFLKKNNFGVRLCGRFFDFTKSLKNKIICFYIYLYI